MSKYIPEGARRSAYLQRAEAKALEEVPCRVPAGFTLASCEPLVFQLGLGTNRVSWQEVTAHVGESAHPVAGVVLLPNVYTSAYVVGSPFPQLSHLHSWRPVSMDMQEGDTLEFFAMKRGEARLFPFTGLRREIVLTLGGPDDGMPEDPFEGLPLPGKLAEVDHGWHR